MESIRDGKHTKGRQKEKLKGKEMYRKGASGWRLGVVVSVVGRINEVNQHRARLVLSLIHI